MLPMESSASIETIARLIQLSLTPVFLLSALASLLAVFAGRLARVADRVDQIGIELERADASQTVRLTAELAYQRRRTRTLDIAVVMGALGGTLTCAAVLVMFVGALTGAPLASLLFALFGAAILAAIGALAAFVCEMLLASRGVRRRSRNTQDDASSGPFDGFRRG